MERIECGQSFGVFVDYAHTPDALSVVFFGYASCDVTRRADWICVFGRWRPKRTRERWAIDGPVTVEQRSDGGGEATQDNPRREPPERIEKHDPPVGRLSAARMKSKCFKIGRKRSPVPSRKPKRVTAC